MKLNSVIKEYGMNKDVLKPGKSYKIKTVKNDYDLFVLDVTVAGPCLYKANEVAVVADFYEVTVSVFDKGGQEQFSQETEFVTRTKLKETNAGEVAKLIANIAGNTLSKLEMNISRTVDNLLTTDLPNKAKAVKL
jgi:hypothetical protein